MTRELVLRQEARRDLEDAASWYDDQRLGLGKDFVAETREVFQTIGAHSAQFRADAEQVVVLAVLHKRRHPDTWRLRLP